MKKELCKLFNVSELMRLTIEAIDKIDDELHKKNLKDDYRKELEWNKSILVETRDLYYELEQRGSEKE